MNTSINHTDIQRGIERAHEIRSQAAHKAVGNAYFAIRKGVFSLHIPKIALLPKRSIRSAPC